MDKSEAGELLRNHLNPWRTRSYRELADRIGETERLEVSGASETQYQVTTQVFWDSKPHGDLRVVGSIDDGGWRAFLPLSDSFIMAPDGSFVAERAARELMQLVDEARSRFGDKLDWPERGRGLWRRARGACASDADAGDLTDAIAQHAYRKHWANTVLGLLACRNDDLDRAVSLLRASADVRPEYRLSSYGPSLNLVREVCARGRWEDGLEFLRVGEETWDHPRLREWIAAVEERRLPETDSA